MKNSLRPNPRRYGMTVLCLWTALGITTSSWASPDQSTRIRTQISRFEPAKEVRIKGSKSIRECLAELKAQTGISPIYSEDVYALADKKSVDLDGTVDEVLNELATVFGVECILKENEVLIRRKQDNARITEQKQTQQGITVQGTVVDEDGQPLPGVSVLVKGSTTTGTVTDMNGNYALTIKSQDKPVVLTYSFVGFKTSEKTVSSSQVLNLELSTSTKNIDDVIVTGRAGASDRTKLVTSYSVTNVNYKTLSMQGPTSVTETLKSIPGFWVESSGGEASGNVRARGIPVDGYGSIQLLEDGLPVQHDPALGYLNADQAFRFDETIDKVEVVRGGPSSVFYSNAPAGAVNYISRSIGDETEGVLKFTAGSGNLYRTDFWIGAPVDEWKLSLGGFYRTGSGLRDPGYAGNHGGQIKVSIGRQWDHTEFNFDFKHLDDNVIFYAGLPMTYNTDGDIVAVSGINGHTGTIAGPETERLKMIQGDGSTYDFDNTLGTHVKRTQLTVKLKTTLLDHWTLSNISRYHTTFTQRNGVFPNSLQPATDFIENAEANLLTQVPGADHLGLTYVSDDKPFDSKNQNQNGLMIIGGLRGLTLPVNELMSDTRISRTFELGSTKHDVNLGYYFAHLEEDFSRYSSSVLLDVQDNAKLLDLVAYDADGNPLSTFTDNGVYRYGYEWEDAHGQQNTHAIYLSDEWQISQKLRLDGGFRWEEVRCEGIVGQKKTVDLGTFASSNILTGNGKYDSYNTKSNYTTWTLGTNYQISNHAGAFARYTSAARIPGLGSYVTNVNAEPVTQKMNLGEVGYKYNTSVIALYATGFWTKYNSISYTNFIFDNNGNSISENFYADTQTFGLELELGYYPMKYFDVTLSSTFQNGEYKGLTFVDENNKLNDYDGNKLIRTPSVGFRVIPAFNLFDNKLRVQTTVEYAGKRYVDIANSMELPSYTKVDLSAQAKIAKNISVFGYIDNLNNSLGLTEGNPRQGEIQNTEANAASFLARPIFGRNYKLAIRFNF